MNTEEQKNKTYIELYKLLELVPFKYKTTRTVIKDLMNLLNQEEWKIKEIKESA